MYSVITVGSPPPDDDRRSFTTFMNGGELVSCDELAAALTVRLATRANRSDIASEPAV